MAVGDTITAARYNAIQGRIATVMGKGAGDEGYGQRITSFQISATDLVTAQNMNDLYEDIRRARLHQTGSNPTDIAEITAGVDIVEDNNSSSNKGYSQYEAESILSSSQRLTKAGSQMQTEAGVTSTRTASWNGRIYHEVTVTFNGYSVTNGDGSTTAISGADHRRAFFNSGGEITFDPSVASGGANIDADWRSLTSSVGVVRFGYTETTNGSIGTNIGHVDLTTSFQTIFIKSSTAYGANEFQIDAKEDANDGNVLRFRIRFNDDKGANPNFDEAVTRPTTSAVGQIRAANTDSVSVPTPVYATVAAL